MRETHRGATYKPGDYWRECGVCGFDYLRSEMVTRWDGLLVCQADNDEQNPQDTPSYNHNHPPFRAEGSGEISVPVFRSTGNYVKTETGYHIFLEDDSGGYVSLEE